MGMIDTGSMEDYYIPDQIVIEEDEN